MTVTINSSSRDHAVFLIQTVTVTVSVTVIMAWAYGDRICYHNLDSMLYVGTRIHVRL